MAGAGDAPSVPIWDMAVLAGATLFISTIVIVAWTQPVTYDLDGDPQEVLTIHTGFSEASLTFESVCLDDTCNPLSAWIIPHDGQESWDGSLFDGQEVNLLDSNTSESETILNQPLTTGEYRIILEGEGSYSFETTVNRNLPHEYIPAIIGALLVVWGIWRKQLEDSD
jgi:hypothetical protein